MDCEDINQSDAEINLNVMDWVTILLCDCFSLKIDIINAARSPDMKR